MKSKKSHFEKRKNFNNIISTGFHLKTPKFIKMIIYQMQLKTKSLTIISQIQFLMKKKTAKINLKISFKKIFRFLY